LFPQWSHHVYPQFLPGTHPNHQQTQPQVLIQQQHHQHYHQIQQQQQQQSHHHLSNANNNYINANASMMNVNNTANISPILHNNHIINSNNNNNNNNNNHQHLHQTNMSYGQMLSNDIQGATFYQQQQQQQQQQHQFMQHSRASDGNVLINNTIPSLVGHNTNGLAHIKARNRLMKNNGLNNNFYRSSGILISSRCYARLCAFYTSFFYGFFVLFYFIATPPLCV
jgi:hypothetical protein